MFCLYFRRGSRVLSYISTREHISKKGLTEFITQEPVWKSTKQVVVSNPPLILARNRIVIVS